MNKFLMLFMLNSLSLYFGVIAVDNHSSQNIYHSKKYGTISNTHISNGIYTTVIREIKSKKWIINATKHRGTLTSCLTRGNIFVYMASDDDVREVIPNPSIVKILKHQIEDFEHTLTS